MPRIQGHALTTRWVKQVTKPGEYGDGYGLALRIDARGNKRWVQRLSIDGKQRNTGLGTWPEVTLDDARVQALTHWQAAKQGRNPIEEKRIAQGSASMPDLTTFADAARRVIALRRPTWSNTKHAAQWESSLKTYVFPFIGDKPVREVTPADVLAVLEPIWTAKPETAARLRQRMEVVFDYAITAGNRTDNPTRSIAKALPRQRRTKTHHPAMPYAQLPDFMKALRTSPTEAVTRLALRFLILTAARSGEVRFMEWAEVDVAAATWTVPAARMKARREHRVPLSRRALEVLEEVRSLGQDGSLVFPSRKGEPLSNMAFTMLLRRHAAVDAVPHGFRSTFKDWTLEQTSFPWAVVETALAHTLGSATEAAYARSDLFERRRELMEAWARHCGHGRSTPPAKPASHGAARDRASLSGTKQPFGKRVLGALWAACGIQDRA